MDSLDVSYKIKDLYGDKLMIDSFMNINGEGIGIELE